jgi:hypothetical protein
MNILVLGYSLFFQLNSITIVFAKQGRNIGKNRSVRERRQTKEKEKKAGWLSAPESSGESLLPGFLT